MIDALTVTLPLTTAVPVMITFSWFLLGKTLGAGHGAVHLDHQDMCPAHLNSSKKCQLVANFSSTAVTVEIGSWGAILLNKVFITLVKTSTTQNYLLIEALTCKTYATRVHQHLHLVWLVIIMIHITMKPLLKSNFDSQFMMLWCLVCKHSIDGLITNVGFCFVCGDIALDWKCTCPCNNVVLFSHMIIL